MNATSAPGAQSTVTGRYEGCFWIKSPIPGAHVYDECGRISSLGPADRVIIQIVLGWVDARRVELYVSEGWTKCIFRHAAQSTVALVVSKHHA